MVRTVSRLIIPAAMVLFALPALAAKLPAHYQIGDTAKEDIFTPIELVVPDPETTEILKEREGQQVPAVFRYYPQTADEQAAAFHSAFDQTRSHFLDAVERTFQRRQLRRQELAAPEFERCVAVFQEQNQLFPVNLELARRWAGGESDETLDAALEAKLREAMKPLIRPKKSPDEVNVGSLVRLVPLGENEPLTAQIAEQRGTNVAKTNFVAFLSAKADLQGSFAREDEAAARYVASFFKPNCTVESALTRELRARYTCDIAAADRYAAGQILARRGQTIDKKIKTALDELEARTASARTRWVRALLPAGGAWNSQRISHALAVWGAGAEIAILLIWEVARRRRRSASLPATVTEPSGALVVSGRSGAMTESWRRRALAAEQRADKTHSMIRTGLVSHLARWMSDALVQRLLLQRAQMIDVQRKAISHMDLLEQRLDSVQMRMQDRFEAYEQRIAELEKELDTKDEQNRELIKAEIQMIKRRRELARANIPAGLN